MTVRSVALGLTLGVVISLADYFNEFVIRQSSLINHLLPLSVLGTIILLALAVNPLLRLIGVGRYFTAGEIGVVAAISLAACTWPGAGFFRTNTQVLTIPAQDNVSRPSWQSAGVMSYLPGGSGDLAPGQILDWPGLIKALQAASQHDGPLVMRELWTRFGQHTQQTIADCSTKHPPTGQQQIELLHAVNQALEQHPLSAGPLRTVSTVGSGAAAGLREQQTNARFNHRQLATALPEVIAPLPKGAALLPDGGLLTEPVEALIRGTQPRYQSAMDLPWHRWWPTAGLWAGLALLLGLASFCLAVIVHPLWSDRELLPYPIPRFVTELTQSDSNRRLPNVVYKKGFWVALFSILALHLVNGLHSWANALPQIPLTLNFSPLAVLFPHASHVSGMWAYLRPTIFFSVAAFAYFIPGSVSASLGLAPMAYVILGSVMMMWGTEPRSPYFGAGSGNMLRFGAYVGMTGIMLYTGRAYYMRLARATVGQSHHEVPSASVWAARAVIILLALAMMMLNNEGVAWPLAAACVLMLMLIFLVIARITAETGMFFIQPYWFPVTVLTGLFGFNAIGPTAYIVLALASTVLAADTKTALLANLVNAFKIADDAGKVKPGRLSPWMLVMILGGFGLAGVATLSIQLHYGAIHTSPWSAKVLPAAPFNSMVHRISTAASAGTLSQSVSMHGLQRLAAIHLSPSACVWLGIGIVLVIAGSLARMRISWWPVHPVIFLIWGTFPANRFAFSFLLGWAVKTAVVRVGGARAYAQGMPILVGVIAGAMLGGAFWIVIGVIYYCATGMTPAAYSVF